MNGQCFEDGRYFGDVIYSDQNIIRVEVKNGNKYMEGQIMNFSLSNHA